MSTVARATLRVDVVGEKKVDALNKKLASIGKGAFGGFDAKGLSKDLDRAAKSAERSTQKIADVAERSAKRVAASSAKIAKASGGPWDWAAGDAKHRALVSRNVAFNRQRAAADAAMRSARSAFDPKVGPWGTRRARSAFDITQSAAMREKWAKGPWGGGQADEKKQSRLGGLFGRANNAAARLNGGSVGRGVQGGTRVTTEFLWSTLPFGSGALWSLLDIAMMPATALSKLAGVAGGVVGPLGAVVGGIAGLGAGLTGLYSIMSGLFSTVVTLKAAFKGIELGAKGAADVLDRRYASLKAGRSQRAQGVFENAAVGLGIGKDHDEARKKLADLGGTMDDVRKGNANKETQAAAERLGLTKRPKKGADTGWIERGRDAFDAAKTDKDRKRVVNDLETVYGAEIAKAIIDHTKEQIAEARQRARQMPVDDETAAQGLSSEAEKLNAAWERLGATIKGSLIAPTERLFAALNEKMDGPEGKTIARALSDMFGDAVKSVTAFVNEIKPGDIEATAGTIRDAFRSITESAKGFADALKAMAEGRWADLALRGGLTKEEQAKRHAQALTNSEAGRPELRRDRLARDYEGAGHSPAEARRMADEAEARYREEQKRKLDQAMAPRPGMLGYSNPQQAYGSGSDVADRIKAAGTTLQDFANTLPGKGGDAGRQLAEAAGSGLNGQASTIGSAIGMAAAAALKAAAASITVKVDASGARAAVGSLSRTGRDVPQGD